MSGYLNRVSLIGNLGADPEVRNTQSGQMIVTMNSEPHRVSRRLQLPSRVEL
ncbi:single-stranded DNA-binding protein [Acidisoma sp. 7E03]